ncbi:MAG: cob(I)yrinic acid a,c-diamide adenosyltransferase [Pseudomonadota bacterium]
MVKLDKIYTKTGDRGKTRLSTGEPVDKWHPRVAAYGTVDETNAALGIAALHAQAEMLAAIRRIQNDLFDLGADLATPDRGKALEWEPLRIVEAQTTRLETEIDAMNVHLAPLDSFILPGGSALAAHFHVARTLSRRGERQIAEIYAMQDECVSDQALAYANRLSDWLFVAGRIANANGADDVKWVPGANR